MQKRIKREMLEALVDFQEKIGKLEFDKAISFAIKQITLVLGVERCSVFKLCNGMEKAYLVAGEPKNEHGIGMCFSFNELETIKEVIEKKRNLLISDPKNDDRIREKRFLYEKDINAILFIPLIATEEVRGIIVVDATKEKKFFDEEDVYFCLNIANMIALLMERDTLHKRKAEAKKTELLAQVAKEAAHRLRNPVFVIGGFAKSLVRKLENSPYQKDVQVLLSATKKLQATIDGLLMFSSGPKKKRLKKTNVNEIIKEIEQEAIKIVKEKKKVKTELKLSPNIPPIFVDCSDIKYVFMSIISNAIEAIQEEGEISIKSKAKQGRVVVSITNNAGCVDREIASQMFNPFFTTKDDGTGLGLSIASAIVGSYKGSIKMESDDSLQLTSFIVSLPPAH